MIWVALSIFLGALLSTTGYCYIMGFDRETTKVHNMMHPAFDKRVAILMAAAWVVSIGLIVYTYYFSFASGIRLVLICFTMILLAILGWLDHQYRLIPNQLLLVGAAVWLVMTLLQILISGVSVRQSLLYSGAGFLIIGGILWIIAALAKGAFGMGDVKLFCLLGLLYGLTGSFLILFFTASIMAVISIVLLIARKATIRSALPMAPFVAIGFVIAILLGI